VFGLLTGQSLQKNVKYVKYLTAIQKILVLTGGPLQNPSSTIETTAGSKQQLTATAELSNNFQGNKVLVLN
jgi:hydroxymethylpyrimidine pyrophosphatase-like HAD family hydrolase